MSVAVELAPGASENGLATMLAGLVQQNLEARPEKTADFRKLRINVGIVAEDAGVALTLEFTGDKLIVHDGLYGMPDATIRGSSDDIAELSLVELLPRIGIPNPMSASAKKLSASTKSGSLRMLVPLHRMPAMLRVTRVMSVT
jgi:hypothetical protein